MKAQEIIILACILLIGLPIQANAKVRIKNYRHIEGREMVLGLTFADWLSQGRQTSLEVAYLSQSQGLNAISAQSTQKGATSAPSRAPILRTPPPSFLSLILWLVGGISASLFMTFVGLPTLALAFGDGKAIPAMRPYGVAVILLTLLGLLLVLIYGGATGAYVAGVSAGSSAFSYALKSGESLDYGYA